MQMDADEKDATGGKAVSTLRSATAVQKGSGGFSAEG
jgi:hypothetical protein